MLGIDPDKPVYYEGSRTAAVAIWPSCFLSLATIIHTDNDWVNVPKTSNLGLAPLIFREDHFDAVTRIRRGRFYNRDQGGQPQPWSVQQHPSIPSDARRLNKDALVQTNLFGFYEWSARTNFPKPLGSLTVALGIQGATSLWRVVDVEHISTGEDLVTLKAKSNMGMLPEIVEERIPKTAQRSVLERINNLIDTAYRSGADSVIDRCRDLASAVLNGHYEATHSEASTMDLGELVKIASKDQRYLVENASRLLTLLHARTKPSERNRRGTPAPGDEDAALALECVGLILREVGWTK